MGATESVSGDAVAQQRDRFVERMLQATSGAFAIFTIYLGDRLGLYRALAEGGPVTPPALAGRTGIYARYAREWLEQQAVAGVLQVEDAAAPPEARRYHLPAGHAEVLVDPDSLNYLAPLARLVAGAVRPLPALLEAFRSGGGVPFADYGEDLREGQAAFNRPMFLRQLGAEWLPALPEVHARLLADPPARVADLGCGAGWSSIGIAQAYPRVRVDGLDLDAPSVELARANAAAVGLTARVTFHRRDAGDPALAGQYDLVTAFECIHDMSDPVAALRAMRALAGERGTALVVDERIGDAFMGPGGELEWYLYGFSVLHCLPVGLAERPSAETGTAMRPSTLRRYAREAGFRDIAILPIDHPFFHFYRMVP